MPGARPAPPASRWRSYRHVDATIDPGRLSAELDDIASIPFVAEQKLRSLELLELAPGDSVLDVGCGNGGELAHLARRVGSRGRVVGLDVSTSLLADAQARGLSASEPTELAAGDAHSLPFADGEFHACRADRALQHLAEPDLALSEMARVTRGGGRVVVTELRWGLVAPALTREVTDQVLQFVATDAERANWIGYRLAQKFERAGLTEVQEITADSAICEPAALFRFTHLQSSAQAAVHAGVLAPEQAHAWLDHLGALVRGGEALAVVIILHVTGTKRPSGDG